MSESGKFVGNGCRRSSSRLSLCRYSRSTRGFTIIELVAVMAVMALAMGIGAYSMGDWRARGNFTGIVNGMRNAINLTRARAIARQKPVILQVEKPVPRDQWKHSENYLVTEKSDPADPNGRFYWIEFTFVQEINPGGTPYYVFLVGDPAMPLIIDSSLNYLNSNAMDRGQICFSGRGYAVSPTSTSVPRTFAVEVYSQPLKRRLRMNVSPVGQVSTQAMEFTG